MKSKVLLPLIIFFTLCPLVYSQETDDPENASQEQEAASNEVASNEAANFNPDTLFVINSFNFNINGRTRPDAVMYLAELTTGEVIKGFNNLEKYILDKKQLLLNERVLENVNISYTLADAREDGKIPVDLTIDIKDTWNIIALPYPKYSSNSGFDLILKARDYNFLGTMSPLRLDVGYSYDETGRNSILVELDSNTPFKAFGYNFIFKFIHSFNYRPDTEEPYYYRNITGLSMELPYKSTVFTFGFDETFIVNDENSDDDKPLYGNFQSGLYMSSNPYIAWKIPTGINVGDYGSLTYTPKISAVINHEFPKWPLAEIRKGPTMSFGHNLGFERINWIGNYRKGIDAHISNSYGYDFHKLSIEEQPWSADLNLTGVGHFIITDLLGVSTRLMYRQWFFSEQGYGEAGDAVRGVLNKSIRADYMLSLNLDFPMKIFAFLPSQWFEYKIMRLFDFDMHFSPVIDMALYHDPVTETPFDFKNILVTGGFEFIVFPAFMRSLYLRISLAWNLVEQVNNPRDYYLNPILPIVPHLPSGNNREIFVGIGHHY